jgi:hypothetical protein
VEVGFRFWRLRYGGGVENGKCWSITYCEFFSSPDSTTNLCTDPNRAYSSSIYGPTYPASNAFNQSAKEWGTASGVMVTSAEWIAYEFESSKFVRSIHIVGRRSTSDDIPLVIDVQASTSRFSGFKTIWTIHNPTKILDKRFHWHERTALSSAPQQQPQL